MDDKTRMLMIMNFADVQSIAMEMCGNLNCKDCPMHEAKGRERSCESFRISNPQEYAFVALKWKYPSNPTWGEWLMKSGHIDDEIPPEIWKKIKEVYKDEQTH